MNQLDIHDALLATDEEPLSQVAVEKVLDIVERATAAALPEEANELQGKWRTLGNFINRHKRKLSWTGVGLTVVLSILAFGKSYVDRHFLVPIALLISVLVMVTGFLMILAEIVVTLPFLFDMRKRPFAFFFSLLRRSTTFDLQYLHELAACDVAALQYVLKHYQYHRIALEKRGGAIGGNIDRIGLFPALAAVALLWSSLSQSTFGPWLPMLVPLIFGFHLMNLYSFGLQQRMDRIIATLEFSVGSRRP